MNQQEPHRQGQSVLEYQQDSVSPIYKRGISAHFGCWEVSRPPPFSLSFTSSYGMARFLFLWGWRRVPTRLFAHRAETFPHCFCLTVGKTVESQPREPCLSFSGIRGCEAGCPPSCVCTVAPRCRSGLGQGCTLLKVIGCRSTLSTAHDHQ